MPLEKQNKKKTEKKNRHKEREGGKRERERNDRLVKKKRSRDAVVYWRDTCARLLERR